MLVQKKLWRRCPICGSTEGTVLKSMKIELPSTVNLRDRQEIVSCTSCGFTFADTESTQEDYNEYYTICNTYCNTTDIRVGLTKSINENRYELFCKYVDKKKRILDMGCGDGNFLSFLKENGYTKLYGIDPSKNSVDKLHKKGIEGHIGSIFSENKKLEETFDVVVCTAVLEHLFQINNFIENIKPYLKADGMLFVEVPAVEGFNKYITEIPNYFNQEHIN